MNETNETTEAQPVAERRQARTGLVASTGGDKTIRVIVENLIRHKQYGKYMRRRKRIAVHDPQNVANVGDTVEIVPCKRMSRSKAWRLVRVVRAATIATKASVESS